MQTIKISEEFKTSGDYLKGVASNSEVMGTVLKNTLPIGGIFNIEIYGTISGNSTSTNDALGLSLDFGSIGEAVVPLIDKKFETYEKFKININISNVYKSGGGTVVRWNIQSTSYKNEAEIVLSTNEGLGIGVIGDCDIKLKHTTKSEVDSIFKVENFILKSE